MSLFEKKILLLKIIWKSSISHNYADNMQSKLRRQCQKYFMEVHFPALLKNQ